MYSERAEERGDDRDGGLWTRFGEGLWQGASAGGRWWSPRSLAASLLLQLPSRTFRRLGINLSARCQGGTARSRSFRERLWRSDGVLLGAFSHGPGLQLGALPPNTVIGRFCSIGPHVVVANENHPIDRLSSSGLLFDPVHGVVAARCLPPRPVTCIGHDVWIGANACVLPGCRSIGHGAVVAAGAVITHDVPPLAIVAGNPARHIGARMDGDLARAWLHSAWWRHAPETLLRVGAAERAPIDVLTALAAFPPGWTAAEVESDERFGEAAGAAHRTSLP